MQKQHFLNLEAPESSHLGSRIRPAGLPNQATWAPESSPWVPQVSFCEPPNQAPANPRIRPLRISNETQTLIQTPRHTESQTKRHIHTHIHTHTHTRKAHTHMHTCACWCTQMQTKSHENQQSTRSKKSHEKPPNPRILLKNTISEPLGLRIKLVGLVAA